ncbi:MAG: trypsin-like peptidase domain-containing protein [Campylobacterota bacterium]|nr:trypsin-like peptidase domain-containing protein [Campylobacterota bacterium]
MKSLIKITLLLSLIVTVSFSSSLNDTTKSIVKVFTTASTPNYKYPWQTSKIAKFTGSGAIIIDNHILTAAHVVTGAKLLEVKKENDPKKYLAKIKYISHQADLALLKVEDVNFFNDTKQLTLSTNAKVRDEVTVIGYPIGGKNVSTTTGVISRIEQQYYVYSAEKLLAIQVDAAINSGNSGGAVVNNNNQLVGIAMMKKLKAENIAYIVPTVIINTFLEDIKDGIVDGFSKEHSYFSPIENDTLKEFYGLKNGNGILISTVDKYNDKLKLNDIILSIDGNQIANNGTISTLYGRISFLHIYHTKQLGDTITLNILRDKKVIEVETTIKKIPKLVEYKFAKDPKYIIYGGLVFAPITKNYLRTLSKHESERINKKLYSKKKSEEYQEAISMLSTVFPHKVNKGYSNWASVLKSVNGTKIKSFKHLVHILDNIEDKYTKFEFEEQSTIIIDTQMAKDSFKDIQNIYRLSGNRAVK